MLRHAFFALLLLLLPQWALAAGPDHATINLHITASWVGITALILFAVAYLLVMTEEITQLRKSKPVMVAAGLIWALIAGYAATHNLGNDVSTALRQNLSEYTDLLLFLLVAMTYVNAMEDRGVFNALRIWLVQRHLSYRSLFWITGTLAFFMSPLIDNLTTALVMSAIVLAVGKGNPRFIALACINIVVAANAGGAFIPFGNITTLLVWQKGVLEFQEFFPILIPAAVNFVVTALCMVWAVPKGYPEKVTDEKVHMEAGALVVVGLFMLTMVTAVVFHMFLGLPAMMGMMMGLAFLQWKSFYLQRASKKRPNIKTFDVFQKIAQVEWDTLLFFYGIILCVGGLATIGYLGGLSDIMYNEWGQSLPAGFTQTPANIMIGILSAVIDNIPVMFAVLTMNPTMSEGQWLLVTLTAGVGGSLLSIGSAAGVALMGQARGVYTFLGHLKWTWAIALGYVASIACHLWVNHHLFLKY